MYSIDVNFLKDRHLDDTAKSTLTKGTSSSVSLRKQLPMFIGIGAGASILALTGLLGMIVNWQKAETGANIQQLDAEISQINNQTQKISEIETQITALNDETQSLVSVFNQIKPWSAILQEIRTQTPANVQVTNIQQIELPAEPDNDKPKARTQIKIDGYARSYEDTNNFLLTLQNSPFFNAKATKIESTQLTKLPLEVQTGKENILVELPQVIQYTISTELNDIPASNLLPALARNGAVGLVTRIQTLEQRGVIQR